MSAKDEILIDLNKKIHAAFYICESQTEIEEVYEKLKGTLQIYRTLYKDKLKKEARP